MSGLAPRKPTQLPATGGNHERLLCWSCDDPNRPGCSGLCLCHDPTVGEKGHDGQSRSDDWPAGRGEERLRSNSGGEGVREASL